MNKFISRLFYATDVTSMWPDFDGLFTLMVDSVISVTGKSEADAILLLNTSATFPGRSKGTTLQRKPVKVLRAAVPHLMTAIKKVAAKAFVEKYHEVTGAGTRVRPFGKDARGQPRKGNSALVLSRNESAKCLWKNSFLTSTPGVASMQAVVGAVVSKWANINDFLVPASARFPERHYKISSLLYVFLVMKVRVALRESAGLPRLVWGGDHIDEGHRKLFAAELLGSGSFVPDHCVIRNGLLFIDATLPERRRVPGFGKRGLVVILKRMKLTKKPSFAAGLGDTENGIESEIEKDVVMSDFSDQEAPGHSSDFSFDAADGRHGGEDRTGIETSASVGHRSDADGEDQRWNDEEGDAVVGDSDVEDSQYWGLGDDGQGARWDDDRGQGDVTIADVGLPTGSERNGTR